MRLNNNRSCINGFTLVEVMIVIVVIGILATVGVVGYNGMQQKAAKVSIQSDLKNAAAQLESDRLRDQTFPSSASGAANGKGLVASTGTTFQYFYNPDSNVYCLSASSSRSGVQPSYIMGNSDELKDGSCPDIGVGGGTVVVAPNPPPVLSGSRGLCTAGVISTADDRVQVSLTWSAPAGPVEAYRVYENDTLKTSISGSVRTATFWSSEWGHGLSRDFAYEVKSYTAAGGESTPSPLWETNVPASEC